MLYEAPSTAESTIYEIPSTESEIDQTTRGFRPSSFAITLGDPNFDESGLTRALALITADERKFRNKDDFMNAETPGWWTTKPAVDRMATLECKRADYFSTYFGSTTPRIQQLWADAISDIEEVVNKRGCLNDPVGFQRQVGSDLLFAALLILYTAGKHCHHVWSHEYWLRR